MEDLPGVGDAAEDGLVDGLVDGSVVAVDEVAAGSAAARAGLSRVWGASLWRLSDAGVREATGEVFAVLQVAHAAYLRLVGELDARPGAVPGARSGQTARSFLVGRLHRSAGQAWSDVRAAHAVRTIASPDAAGAAAAAGQQSGAAGAGDAGDAAGVDPLDAARGLPRLGAALAEGLVSREHLDVAVTAVRRIPTHLLTAVDHHGEDEDRVAGRARVEDYLLAQSQSFSPAQVDRLARHLLAVLDPDGTDRFDPDADTRRELTLMLDSTGMVGLRGWLTAIPGAMLTALIDHYAAPHPPRQETAEDGTLVQIIDTRTGTQRRADALTRIITDAATHNGLTPAPETAAPDTAVPETAAPETAAPETAVPETAAPETAVPETPVPETPVPETAVPETPVPETAVPDTAALETAVPETAGAGRRPVGEVTRGGERPRITVLATIEQIREAFDRARHPGPGPGPVPRAGGWGWAGAAECQQTGPITPRVLGQLLCDAVLERVLLAPDGAVLNLGRSVRTATAAQKRALAARDGGCVTPGCTTPWQHCDIHHITWYSHGGNTDLDNLALLCPHHHTQIHNGHLELRMIHGVPETRLPTWQDPHRRWTRNTYWTTARPHTHHLAQQLRLTLEGPGIDPPPNDGGDGGEGGGDLPTPIEPSERPGPDDPPDQHQGPSASGDPPKPET